MSNRFGERSFEKFTNSFDNKRNFTAAEYDIFKKYAEEKQPVLKMLPLGTIKLINENTIEITYIKDNVRKTGVFEISKQALKSLVRLYKLTATAFSTLSDTFDNEQISKIIEQIKYKSTTDLANTNVMLSIAKGRNYIIDIIKTGSEANIINTNQYFKLVESALNGFECNGMEVKNLVVSEDGNLAITVLNNNWTFDAGFNDEFFKTGMTLIKTPTSMIINPFNERLVCRNGMISSDKQHSLVLNSTSKDAMKVFFEKAQDFGKSRGAFERDFKERVIKMLSHNASYAEVEYVYNTIKNNINTQHERSKIYLDSTVSLNEIYAEYLKKTHIHLETKNDAYKKRIITDYNLWELVNILTDISSNVTKHDLDYINTNDAVFNMQKAAGNLSFKNEYDLGDSVPQIFEANAEMDNAAIIAKIKSSLNKEL